MPSAVHLAITQIMNNPLDVVIQVPCDLWSRTINKLEARCRRAASAAFSSACGNADLPQGPIEVCVVLADDSLVRSLNRRYRDKDEATNVLAFANLEATLDDTFTLGDIIVSYHTASAEAGKSGKGIDDHLCHLVVHGMLHLLGYDHNDDTEAMRMEALEINVLSGLGVADPFATEIGV